MSQENYRRIEQAIHYLETHQDSKPSLQEMARAVALSPFHFQRLFSRWAGISPHRFLQVLSLNHAKSVLLDQGSILDAAYEAGISGPGRLHDLFITHEAVTPGQFKQAGEGLTLLYGLHPSPFGTCLLAASPQGICYLGFPPEAELEQHVEAMQAQWPRASWVCDSTRTLPWAESIFAPAIQCGTPLKLHVRGTNFQIRIWHALLRIPAGSFVSYADLARMAGQPRAARGVGQALGRNPVAFLIPCHRVIRATGVLGDYRWGATRKKAMLAWEYGWANTHSGESAAVG